MASYMDLLAGLEDEPLPSKSLQASVSLSDARAQASIQKYQNISPAEDYDYRMKVMAVGVSSNTAHDQCSPLQSVDSAFAEFQAEVAKESVGIHRNLDNSH